MAHKIKGVKGRKKPGRKDAPPAELDKVMRQLLDTPPKPKRAPKKKIWKPIGSR